MNFDHIRAWIKAEIIGVHEERDADERLRVLVVDDDVEILTVFARAIHEIGHTVTVARSGNSAGRILRERAVDLLITDIIMPDGDGATLISEAQRLQPRMKIIAISGGGFVLGATDCTEWARRSGADLCIVKPVSPSQLRAAIRSPRSLDPCGHSRFEPPTDGQHT